MYSYHLIIKIVVQILKKLKYRLYVDEKKESWNLIDTDGKQIRDGLVLNKIGSESQLFEY